MSGSLVAGIAVGLALLLIARNRERSRDVDAFAAVARLARAGPLSLPWPFWGAAAAGSLAVMTGMPAVSPLARATGALAMSVLAWLSWLASWSSLRALLDAAIVFQDHVPLTRRPASASAPAPAAALSFRPLAAALVLLAALSVTGVGFGLLSLLLGWTRFLPLLAAGVWLVIGMGFASYVHAAMAAERRVRSVLGDPSSVDDERLLDALRRNPRSPRLLIEHARRLESSGEWLQALLEYRAAEVSGSLPEEAREGAERARRTVAGKPGPVEGSIVRQRGTGEPKVLLEPLRAAPDAVAVSVVDPAAFVGELLALADDGLILSVEGEVDAALAQELRSFEHLAPLIERDRDHPWAAMRSWRLEEPVRETLRLAITEGVPRGWTHLRVYTVQRLLVECRSRFARTSVAPDLAHREFLEWRRSGAVGPSGVSGVGGASG
ncbi:MAG: hypothetical protein IBX62_01165 [Coriobacteriia bacterium]|nr:hypothetical protein [Coriobacteriia bacterium]